MNGYHGFQFWKLHSEFGHLTLQGIKLSQFSHSLWVLWQNQEETVLFLNNSMNKKKLPCHLGIYLHSFHQLQDWNVLHPLWKYASKILLQKENKKATNKFIVKVEIPFSMCITGVFKMQLNLYIRKRNNQVRQGILKGKRTQQISFQLTMCCLDICSLKLKQIPLRCRVPQRCWYQQCLRDEAC